MTTNELRKLVEKSILLSGETRAEVLEKLETLDENQKSKLEKLLLDAQDKQEEILKQAFTANPDLIKQIKQDFRKAMVASSKEKEAKSAKEEEQTIADLEDQINNLFE